MEYMLAHCVNPTVSKYGGLWGKQLKWTKGVEVDSKS